MSVGRRTAQSTAEQLSAQLFSSLSPCPCVTDKSDDGELVCICGRSIRICVGDPEFFDALRIDRLGGARLPGGEWEWARGDV